MTVLHLDAETDAKSLLGAYVCGDAPGEFSWQPGALARALDAGRWVLLEDVDGAPAEVMSALQPLLEGRPLPIPGRGGECAPSPGFHLFASITQRGGGSARELQQPSLWARVQLCPPTPSELLEIVSASFPDLQTCVPPMLSSLAAARRVCGQASGEEEAADAAEPGAARARAFSAQPGRELTLRDVMKWAARIRTLHSSRLADPSAATTSASADPSAPSALRELAMLEGADVLGGMLPAGTGRDALLRALSSAWGVPPERGAFYDTLHRPTVDLAPGGAALAVGRAVLPLSPGAPGPQGFGLALTSHARRTLERLAAAVACSEPVLLVGETGCGKTAAVQALARATGQRLVVVNMSTQSDSADLLGGFKPRDAAALCLPLAAAFAAAFDDTFPREANAEFAARVVRARYGPFLSVFFRFFRVWASGDGGEARGRGWWRCYLSSFHHAGFCVPENGTPPYSRSTGSQQVGDGKVAVSTSSAASPPFPSTLPSVCPPPLPFWRAASAESAAQRSRARLQHTLEGVKAA